MKKLVIIIRGAILMFAMTAACFGILGVLGGCSAKVVKPSPPPIAAFGLSQCGNELVLYVIVDANHVLRFDARQTTMFVLRPDGRVSEQSGPPTPFSEALKLAQLAPITSNAIAPCGKPEVTT